MNGIPTQLPRWTILAALLAGCATPTAPLSRDEYYPADWPDLAPLSPDAAEITGTYANTGVVTTDQGGREPIALLSLIPDSTAENQALLAHRFPAGRVVSLQVVTGRKPNLWKEPPGNSTLLVTVDSDSARQAKVFGDFSLRGEAYNLPGGAIFTPIGFGGSDTGIVFNKGRDGSLIVRIHYSGAGLLLVVPMWSSTYRWARFPPASATPAVADARPLSGQP